MANDVVNLHSADLVLDSLARRSPDRSALVGGSPFRVLKLSSAGSALLDYWTGRTSEPADDAPHPESAAASELSRRLVKAGVVHPLPEPAVDFGAMVAIVPVLDDVAGLSDLLPKLRKSLGTVRPIVVVDDGSNEPEPIAELAARYNAVVVCHDNNRGPAAARNTGWMYAEDRWPDTERVLFIDADVVIDTDALALLVAHLEADSSLGIVAPRVVARHDPGALHAYEATNSPLDMGPHPARVAARTRVSYVPSATMLVRAEAIDDVGGFDPAMRVGEDVDFVWRGLIAGWSVRFEPRAAVIHRSRPDLRAMMKQRFGYGTSAALLEDRHPGNVFPVELSVAHLLMWGSAVFGNRPVRVVAAAAIAASFGDLARKLAPKVDGATPVAARIIWDSHRFGLRWLFNAMTRALLPLLLWHRVTRRWLLIATVVPAAIDWWKQRRMLSISPRPFRPPGPSLDPVRFLALRILDHTAYCTGLWVGVLRQRSWKALLPRIRRF